MSCQGAFRPRGGGPSGPSSRGSRGGWRPTLTPPAQEGRDLLILAALLAALVPRVAAAYPGNQRCSFTRTVANVEFASSQLDAQRPGQLLRTPIADGPIWYGVIRRRAPEDTIRHGDRSVPYAVRYADGVAAQVWWDANEDGDLTDDPPVKLYSYPAIEGARSFLANLHWIATKDSVDIPVDWTVRVVLEPTASDSVAPIYRQQMVYAMEGTIQLEGKPHRAFLFDGNSDGLYTKEFGDGMFVDLDDDLHFDIDQFSPSFGPFRVPFQMGNRRYEVDSVEAQGRWLTIRDTGPAAPSPVATVGQPAPDFSFQDLDGRTVRLSDYRGRPVVIQFFASWCGLCEDEAGPLVALYERYRPLGLTVLGVSYDTDRTALERFLVSHRATWPVAYSGRKFFENPIGRLYHAQGAGMMYLVDLPGNLHGVITNVDSLAQEVARRFLSPRATGR